MSLNHFRTKENGVSALEQHKKDLADLATVDPEFYKFLKKEDAGLLDFDVNDEEESIPDDDPEQQIHQLPEQLEEMDLPSDEVYHFKYLHSSISHFSRMKNH